MQWLNASVIPEKYVLMLEQDHIPIKPLPNIMQGERPAVHPFWYITPNKQEFWATIRKFAPDISIPDIRALPPTGQTSPPERC